MRQSVLIPLCPIIYLTVRFAISPSFFHNYTSDYVTHSVVYFLSFLLFPLMFIRRGIYTGRKEFAAGILAYLAITPFFVFLFDHALGPCGRGFEDLLLSVTLVSLNVSAVDFYVFRVVQHYFLKFGRGSALMAGSATWFVVHLPESSYLIDCGYHPLEVLVFMLTTGTLLSTVYSKTKDVLGLMSGHILLNVFVAVTSTCTLASLLPR